MIVDACPLLSVIFQEPRALEVLKVLESPPSSPLITRVNMLEVYLTACDKHNVPVEDIDKIFRGYTIDTGGDANMSVLMEAKAKYRGLNFGDLFVYEAAKRLDMPVLTLDGGFAKCDLEFLVPPKLPKD